MNKTYRLIWNELTHAWVAVAETVRSHGKRAQRSVLAAAILAVLPAPTLAQVAANALPTGGQVVAGTASISQSGAAMSVTQTTQRAAIDWQTFNVGSAATVNFIQPSSSAVVLNRVLSSNPSQIFGQIRANGQVFLSNPNGVYFAPGASVDVGALVATTHSISNADFMAGNYKFSRNGATGSVINEGELKAGLNGYIALLAPEVRNRGVVVAQMGTVTLAAGESYELQFDGSRLANIAVEPATIAALVENGNAVQAPGGLIILSAQAADRLQGGVVKNTGSLEATGLVNDGGTIRLLASDRIEHSGSIKVDAAPGKVGAGGTAIVIADLTNPDSQTIVSGSLSARGGDLGGDGGFIETSASKLSIADSTRVDTRAPLGKTGQWLLDPVNITIAASGDDIAGSTIATALQNSNVTLDTSGTGSCTGATCDGTFAGANGDITVNDNIAVSGGSADTTLTLKADRNIIMNASKSISRTGDYKLNTVYWANNSGTGGYVSLGASSSISTNGGGVWIGGGSGSTTWQPYSGGANLTVGDGAALSNAEGSNAVSMDRAVINTGIGNVKITGQATGTNAYGIWTNSPSGSITTTSGNVSITGTSATNMGMIYRDTVTTTSGTIDVIGTGNAATYGGIYLENGKFLSTSGNITLDGTNSNVGGWGIKLDGVSALGSTGSTSSSNILLKTDSININAGRLASSGTLTIEPKTAGTAITVGSAAAANTFKLSATNFSTHFIDGFSGITIGSTSAGALTVSGATTFNDSTTLRSNSTVAINAAVNIVENLTAIAGGGDLTVAANVAKTSGSDATATFKATGSVIQNSGVSISSSTNRLNTILWSNSGGSGSGYIQIGGAAATSISTNGGGLWMGGGSGSATTFVPYSGGSSLTTGDGYAVGSSTGNNNGIYLGNATITTNGGNIALYGKSSTSGAVLAPGENSNAMSGVHLSWAYPNSINSGTGTIAITGVSQYGVAGRWTTGINLPSSGTYTNSITSAATSGTAITLTGDASGASSTYAPGIWFDKAAISATGGGDIVITGRAGTGTDVEYTKGIIGNDHAASTVSAGAGNLTVIADTVDFAMGGRNITFSGTGSLTVKPYMTGVPIGIAGGAGTLLLPAAYFSSNFTNGFSGITIGSATAGAINVGGSTTLNDSTTFRTNSTIDFDVNLTATENLTLISNGAITQGAAIGVTGTTSITAGSANNVFLNHASNNFTGAVSVVSGNNVSLRDTNALDLGASTVSGTLTLQTGGDLTQSGDLAVTSTTSITAGSGNNVTLDRSGNNFTGAVRVVSGNNVSLRDTNALIIGGAASTVSGDLIVQAGGDITDTSTLAVTGATSLTAGANNITLDGANNFGGAVSIVSANNVTLADSNALVFGTSNISGTLDVTTTTGTITQTGAMTVGGLANLLALGANNDITLTDAGNNFTSVNVGMNVANNTVGARNVSLRDAGAMVFGRANRTMRVTGNLSVQTGGNLTQAATSAIRIDGTTDITAAANDVTLNENGNQFYGGVRFVSARDVTIAQQTAATGLVLGNANGASSISGNLSAISKLSAITQAGALSVTGTTNLDTTTLASPTNITLDNTANDFGGAVTASGVNVTLVDSNAMTLGAITSTGTVDVATQTGDLTLTGAVSTTNTGATALSLNAGKSTAAGTSTGGNIIISGGSVSAGAGGTAKLFSGSKRNSTGLDTLVTNAGGTLNYNADETTGLALAAGKHAVYRGPENEPVETTTPPVPPPPPPAPAVPLPAASTSPPLVIAPPASTSGNTTNAPGVQAATGGNVSVSLVRPPSQQESGIISVTVPREMATAGSGFSFPLPPQVTESTSQNAAVSVTTMSGGPLPQWLRFIQESRTFVASAVPDGAFPMQVIVTTGGISTTIVISARTD